jgi:SAM-dependent methyltransferase
MKKAISYQNIYYPESRFGGFTSIDGTIAFFTRVNSFINSTSVILEIGCGRGAHVEDGVAVRRQLRIFKGKCKKVIGIDVDPGASNNPFLDEFHLIGSSEWPLENDSVDVGVCDFVLEHVEDPDMFFSECRRVIKPSGYLCIRTPNALSYIALFSRLIPNKFHAGIVSKIQNQRKKEDVFPTLYKCNTKRKIKQMFNKYGFDSYVYRYEAEPSYLSINHFTYLMGVMHQRFALNMFKSTIFAFGQKK